MTASPPFLVLDVNKLHDSTLIEDCFARFDAKGDQVAIPAIALFELTRNPEWFLESVAGHFRLLARRPDAVVMTYPARTAGEAEESTGVPTSSMVDEPRTQDFRRLLRDVPNVDGQELPASAKSALTEFRASLRHDEHERSSGQSVRELAEIARKVIPNELRARIGRKLATGNRTGFREVLHDWLSIERQRDAQVRRSTSESKANRLLDARM